MTHELILVMAITLLAVGIILSYLPVEECPECLHCQIERERRRYDEERRQDERRIAEERQRILAHRRYHESTGEDNDCPFCNRRT